MLLDAARETSALDALLAPVGAETFFAEHWEQKPLHCKRDDAHYYEGVLSDREIEALVASADLRYPAIQLARHGGYFPPEAYTRNVNHGSEVFTGVVDVEKVRSEYRAGATIVLPALQRTWRPLTQLCDALESYFTHAVHANAYLTAGGTEGFGPHYDTHEVFVLQVGGRKRWRVFEPKVTLPHRSQPFPRTGYAPPTPLLECELAPGDLLYLPRGYVHSAATSDSHSAHVTIGVTVYTWVELFSELALSAATVPELRRALPVGFARQGEAKDMLARGLAQTFEALRAGTDFGALAEAFTQRVRAARAKPSAAFKVDVRVIGGATVLATPDRLRYAIGTERGNTVLEFDGRKLLLPTGVRATLDAMCALGSFRLGDLPKHLDDKATLAFAQFLETEGFLKPVDASIRS